MIKDLIKYLEKPTLYAKSTCEFWNDEHISKGMLEAHLHPTWEAASRSHDFIDKSVDWIAEIIPLSTYKNFLDLGCGPGLYTERLYKRGYNITGIDFSKRSIQYANQKAVQNNQDINYIYTDYLKMDFHEEFEAVLLIYCDFAVLSDVQRESLLQKVYNSLKPGGVFIFDVFTAKEFEGKTENHTWHISEGNDFWMREKHIRFESHFVYEGDVRLDQNVLIDKEGQVSIFRNWFKGFTKETIIAEVERSGFQMCDIYADATGKSCFKDSSTLCIVAKK
ncbi:class I SAM-dependent methyltransferase [Bacillus sp. HMF5848]|uniref:class I SAM-dependent methyltransferase n=1 Tax=Bacillus sp. HMF5848 TaxID=2495421 RepID=UPI000F782FA6|nr:class I SAM-dependent methyltransferase [Bacillus sp. HMF5848]RSK26114.1 class I SAM-dependent methyltransferase [Bacillus sp. HMF5848]